MARKRDSGGPEVRVKRFASVREADNGIAKLRKRVSEIRGLDPRTTRYDSQRVRNVEQNVDATLLEVFGPASLEYLHNRSFSFGQFARVVASDDDEAQDQFEDAIAQGADLLENLISRIEEQRSDLSSAATGASPPAITTTEHVRDLNPYAILNEQLHALRSRAEALDASPEPSRLPVVARQFNVLLQRARTLFLSTPIAGQVIEGIEAIAEFDESWPPAHHQRVKEEIVSGSTQVLQALAPLVQAARRGMPQSEPSFSRNRDVFIVHGRDSSGKETVARFIDNLGLHAVILHEQPSQGRTTLGKLMKYSRVAFAIVLLAGDDRGGLKDAPPDSYRLRARQNVMLELGFFLGVLGPDRVAALYWDDVEIPSDYEGVVFTRFDSAGAWKQEIERELKAAQIL